VTHSTYVARSDVYAGQYETILRAASVIFRILDDVKQNPAKVAAAQLPFLNAYTGTPLSPANLDAIHQSITVLRDFEGQSEFFDQPSSANDIFTNGQAQIDALVAQKVLKRQHTVSEVDGAKRVWDDLRTYRAESDKLMPKVAAKNPSLAAMAKAQYDARNYLDAYRFLASAKA
jgi:hypothetical protein